MKGKVQSFSTNVCVYISFLQSSADVSMSLLWWWRWVLLSFFLNGLLEGPLEGVERFHGVSASHFVRVCLRTGSKLLQAAHLNQAALHLRVSCLDDLLQVLLKELRHEISSCLHVAPEEPDDWAHDNSDNSGDPLVVDGVARSVEGVDDETKDG